MTSPGGGGITGAGRPDRREPELPAWAHEGAWITVRGGAARVDEALRRARARGARVAAVWAPDWQGVRRSSFSAL